jgi:hypothetical protein
MACQKQTGHHERRFKTEIACLNFAGLVPPDEITAAAAISLFLLTKRAGDKTQELRRVTFLMDERRKQLVIPAIPDSLQEIVRTSFEEVIKPPGVAIPNLPDCREYKCHEAFKPMGILTIPFS